MYKKLGLISLFLLSACFCKQEEPKIIQSVIYPVDNTPLENIRKKVDYQLGIIGEVEPVYIKGMNSPFYARIDTGAKNSSLDAKNIQTFERDGEEWVSFDIENRMTKEKKTFEKKLVRTASIKRQETESEKRIVVNMEIKIGNNLLTKEFSLADRDKFEYQFLIGRNILSGLAVVDVSLKNTLN